MWRINQLRLQSPGHRFLFFFVAIGDSSATVSTRVVYWEHIRLISAIGQLGLCKRHQKTCAVLVRDYSRNIRTKTICLCLLDQVIFKPVSSCPCGVMRPTYHLLGLYSDQLCSTWPRILSQWDSWVLVTTLQCFINRDSCVIHSPRLLADGHVMTVDHCSCILDWDFCPGKICCSLFLRHP